MFARAAVLFLILVACAVVGYMLRLGRSEGFTAAPVAPAAPAAPAPVPVTKKDLDDLKKTIMFDVDAIVKGIKGTCADSPATEQGSEYIRKDSIPCWGCKL